jgi:hypothetical protein
MKFFSEPRLDIFAVPSAGTPIPEFVAERASLKDLAKIS